VVRLRCCSLTGRVRVASSPRAPHHLPARHTSDNFAPTVTSTMHTARGQHTSVFARVTSPTRVPQSTPPPARHTSQFTQLPSHLHLNNSRCPNPDNELPARFASPTRALLDTNHTPSPREQQSRETLPKKHGSREFPPPHTHEAHLARRNLPCRQQIRLNFSVPLVSGPSMCSPRHEASIPRVSLSAHHARPHHKPTPQSAPTSTSHTKPAPSLLVEVRHGQTCALGNQPPLVNISIPS
jgi:hypothetical protein